MSLLRGRSLGNHPNLFRYQRLPSATSWRSSGLGEATGGDGLMAAPVISRECLGWARAANYVCEVDDSAGVMTLRSEAGAPTRYFVRQRARDRLELSRIDISAVGDEKPRPILFAADRDVLERHLVAIFGDDIREDVGLPMLQLPWQTADLAEGCELGNYVRGYRTLSVSGKGPIAAAPDPVLSLLALVPLSHFLRWSVTDLRRAFLNVEGAPLLKRGRYA